MLNIDVMMDFVVAAGCLLARDFSQLLPSLCYNDKCRTILHSSFELGRQHYRLYTIKHIPSLKVLDNERIAKTERDRAERLANSAAGAALESDVQDEGRNYSSSSGSAAKTFTPGVGNSAEESFVVNFTPDEKERIRLLVANAKSPHEIEEIERSIRRGVLPNAAAATAVAAEESSSKEASDKNGRKRPPPEENGGKDAVAKNVKT
jgi:hypothetical protein